MSGKEYLNPRDNVRLGSTFCPCVNMYALSLFNNVLSTNVGTGTSAGRHSALANAYNHYTLQILFLYEVIKMLGCHHTVEIVFCSNCK